jgi:hypothetical protein
VTGVQTCALPIFDIDAACGQLRTKELAETARAAS